MQPLHELYLHVSRYEGATFLAVIADEPIIEDRHYNVLEACVVESRNEAHDWYMLMCKDRPWELKVA